MATRQKKIDKLREVIKEGRFPSEAAIEDAIDLVSTETTALSTLPRERRFFYLHPMCWEWLEVLAEHAGLSVTEYIEAPFKEFGEISSDTRIWLTNRKRQHGLIRSDYRGGWAHRSTPKSQLSRQRSKQPNKKI